MRAFAPRPEGLDAALRAAGITLEWMDTGAACRTFNVLLLDDREVAAALIADCVGPEARRRGG